MGYELKNRNVTKARRKQMKRLIFFTSIYLLLFWGNAIAGNFVSGSTGADGDFAPTENTVLQIPESGVFNFRTVTIPVGVNVSFTKNTKNTPVTILATGDVTIAGAIGVDGKSGGADYYTPGTGGPGGFDGGLGGINYQAGRRGEGPGSGSGGSPISYVSGGGYGGGGGFGGAGSQGLQGNPSYCYVASPGSGGSAYGNARLLSLIGGSGGAGGGGTDSYSGGAGGGGGGAILIASSGTITINGSITAYGGAGGNGGNFQMTRAYGGGGGGGAGGGIKLMADTIAGNGSIRAVGGSDGIGPCGRQNISGASGLIRLEAWIFTFIGSSNPVFSSAYYPTFVRPANMPGLAITAVGGVSVPSTVKGKFETPDIYLPSTTNNPVAVVVTATNIPANTAVTIKAFPAVGSAVSASGTLSGTNASSSASVQINLPVSYPSQLIVSSSFTITASNGGPIYAEGEKVEKVRVTAKMGGDPEVVYITESGKEIPAEKLFARR
ncbi:MAG: hypothetical protein Q7T83_03680 [Thermodesulfovibrionales bacterium]|nr:hypothetical protein [Thermodesulfovibrionales bacterium]